MSTWDNLSMAERAEVMRLAVQNGVYDLDAIRNGYNEFAKGGKIHIKPSKRGTFTAAASKHGKSVQAFASQVLAHKENYSPAMVKKANFAKNASKWKHENGGNLYGGGGFASLVSTPMLLSSNTEGGQKQRKALQFLPVIGTALDAEEAVYNPTVYNAAKFGLSAPSDLFGASLLKGVVKGAKVLKTEGLPKAVELLSPWTASEVKEVLSGTLRYGMPVLDTEMDALDTVKKEKKKEFGGPIVETANIYEGDNPNGQQMQIQRTPAVDLAMSNPWLYDKLHNSNESGEHAIYLHYPNFYGGTGNTVTVGGIDIGHAIMSGLGVDSLPVGHSATVLVDNNGNATYYDYGRYKKGTDTHGVSTFGVIKPQKGNWRKKTLPKQEIGENDSAYVARIQGELPYSNTGDYQVMSFPNVDVKKAIDYASSEAYDQNRKNYGIGNVCADAASRLVLPFLKDEDKGQKIVIPSSEASNTQGYSTPAKWWSLIPFTAGDTARKMRKVAKKTYIMNSNK